MRRVSDRPMVPEGARPDLSDARASAGFAESHIQIGIEALRLIRRNGKSAAPALLVPPAAAACGGRRVLPADRRGGAWPDPGRPAPDGPQWRSRPFRSIA